MKRLIALAKKKPQWLPNEGYWRILQILRMVVFVPLALTGLVFFAAVFIDGGSKIDSYLGAGLSFIAMGVAAFIAVHGIAWMIVWVIAGFSETKKS